MLKESSSPTECNHFNLEAVDLLNEMNRKKTEEVDGQLADLRTQLLQNVSSEGEEKNKKCAVFIKETKPDIEPVASETLTKLYAILKKLKKRERYTDLDETSQHFDEELLEVTAYTLHLKMKKGLDFKQKMVIIQEHATSISPLKFNQIHCFRQSYQCQIFKHNCSIVTGLLILYIEKVYSNFCAGKVENCFEKTTLSTPERDLNFNLPVIGSPVYYKSSALDYSTTKAGHILHMRMLTHRVVCTALVGDKMGAQHRAICTGRPRTTPVDKLFAVVELLQHMGPSTRSENMLDLHSGKRLHTRIRCKSFSTKDKIELNSPFSSILPISDFQSQLQNSNSNFGKLTTLDEIDEQWDHSTSSMDSNIPNSGNVYVCPDCNKVYGWKQSLALHMRLECGKEPQFHCPHCSYKAKRNSSLKSHMKQHIVLPSPLEKAARFWRSWLLVVVVPHSKSKVPFYSSGILFDELTGRSKLIYASVAWNSNTLTDSQIVKCSIEERNVGHNVSKEWKDITIQSSRQAFLEGLSTGLKPPQAHGPRFAMVHAGNGNGFVEGAELTFLCKKNTADAHD
uniref:C2H2-type domain-containing protein n=1 Tax=Timema genevievae TaxID=629358 RepID=A0A7R9JU22_TIMGE|nr:unnamed protein product [Timema genevievae]